MSPHSRDLNFCGRKRRLRRRAYADCIECRSYRENVSMIASAIASAYSSSTKWPPSK